MREDAPTNEAPALSDRRRPRHARYIWWSASGALLAASSTWILGPRLWWADLVANAAAPIGACCLLASLVALGRRRWCPGATMAVSAAIAWWPLLTCRASRTEPPDVRILVWNTLVSNQAASAAAELIAAGDADACVILEPSGELLDLLRSDDAIADRYPHRSLPENAGPGFRVILSRWPLRPAEPDLEVDSLKLRARVVERPGGAFLLVAAHPHSARTPALWRRGNDEIDRIVTLADGAKGRYPVIVAGDFNAGPATSRSRRLCRHALHRATPLLAGGTWPASWPGWLSISIDDVAVSDGVGVASWRRLDATGSDHTPVVVELSLVGAP